MDPGLEQLRNDTRIHTSTISRELGALVAQGVLRQVRGGGRWSGKGYAFVGLDDGEEADSTIEAQGCKSRPSSTLDAANRPTLDGPNSARERNGMETERDGDVRRRTVGGYEVPSVEGSSVSTSDVAARLASARGNGRQARPTHVLVDHVWEPTNPYIAPDPAKSRQTPDGRWLDENEEELPWR